MAIDAKKAEELGARLLALGALPHRLVMYTGTLDVGTDKPLNVMLAGYLRGEDNSVAPVCIMLEDDLLERIFVENSAGENALTRGDGSGS